METFQAIDIRRRQHDAEMAFRRRLIRIGLWSLVAILLYLLVGLYFSRGRIMASSDYRKMLAHRTIIVREGPGAPVWAWPIAWIDDSPQYRFEYYAGGRSLWSCQSFTGESFKATRARIEWIADDTATVYLDDEPIYTCTRGWWSESERH